VQLLDRAVWRNALGAKSALLAFAEGDIRPALLSATRSGRDDVEALVRQIFPGYDVAPADDGNLWEDLNPPDDVTYAMATGGVDLFCDWRLVRDRPSELPTHLLEYAAGRRVVMHGMHSVVDWLCFAVWEDGRLIRSLSLSPDGGIQENIGEPFEFELPYWAGEHRVEPTPGWPNQGPYPFPFHPLDMGEEALRFLFGFVVEGYPSPDDIDSSEIHLHGFGVTDPSGQEHAEREAASARARETMGPPRMFRLGPDGTMHEVSLDDL
jgi:hypothetical protein